jgi:molecular chaperone DnaK
MVMDQWQASLMRTLAQLQLKSNPAARSRVSQQFDLEDDSDLEDEICEDETDDAQQDFAGGEHRQQPSSVNDVPRKGSSRGRGSM